MPPDVRAYLFPWSELNILIVRIVLYMGFPSAIKSFETCLQPRNPRFHEANAQIGEFFEEAIKNNTRESNHLAERMAKAVDGRVRGEIIHA